MRILSFGAPRINVFLMSSRTTRFGRRHFVRPGANTVIIQLHHDVDYTPFEGFELKDWPRYTMLRGQIVYDGDTNQVSGAKGFGKFLKRTSSVLPCVISHPHRLLDLKVL
jgi:hypothetical protein